jgi:pimeloyl-ACP methyl ester carboxylesterase
MLYYTSTGSGKTIVFIHGNSQSAAIWDGLIAEPLLAGYNLVRVDLPGHGQSFSSTDPEKDYTLKCMAAHLPNFLQQFDDYIIVASSLAGNVVAEIINRLKGCKGLFLTGSSIIGEKVTIADIVKPNPFFPAAFAAQPTDEEVEGVIGNWAIHIDEALKKDCIKLFWDTDPAVRTQLGAAIARADWSDEVANLEQLDYPVAAVYGAEEKLVFADHLNKTDIKLWRDSIIEIPDAGHCCQLDQPAQLAGLISRYAADIFRSAGS